MSGLSEGLIGTLGPEPDPGVGIESGELMMKSFVDMNSRAVKS